MRMKKILAMGITMVIVLSSVAGCSSNKDTNTGGTETGSQSSTVAAKDPVKLSFSAADNTFGISTDSDLQKAVTKMLEEKAGVSLTTIIPPVANYSEKVETMISSNDIPDVVSLSQVMTKLPNYVSRGKLMKLDDYIAASEVLSTIPADNYDILRVDGSVYHVPYNQPRVKVLFMRTDIMEEYDIQLSHTPTTEEFVTELSKLEGTGIIPFSFPKWIDNFQYFMNSYGAYAGIYKNEEGVYVDGFQEQAMIEALEYLCRLYEEGIIDQEFITTENATMRENVYTKSAASAIDYVTNYTNYLSQSEAADSYSDVFPIYAIIGPNGDGGGLNEAIQTAFAVSADCKNPEEAIKLIETLVCDAEAYSAFFSLGIEGEHYTLDENNLVVPTDKATNSGYTPKYTYLYESFIQSFDDVKVAPPADIEASLDIQNEMIDAAQQNKGPKYVVPSGISDSHDQVASSITSTWQEVVSQVVLGTVTVEKGMENYRNFWNSIDGDTILKELNGQ
jgi:ABC-type sugar transport system, periplasmic component